MRCPAWGEGTWLGGTGSEKGDSGHTLGAVGVVGADFWSLLAPAGPVRSMLGLRAAAGIAAAVEQRLGWQISPRGSDLRLLPLLKYFQHLTLSTTRFKGLFEREMFNPGTGGGMWGVTNNRLGKGFINMSSE